MTATSVPVRPTTDERTSLAAAHFVAQPAAT